VGLCQIGALGMALNGSSFENILSHYFHSTELKNIYD
jgi:peptidoglycan hydrolase-like amidase